MNIEQLLSVVKNHELVILSGKELRRLIGKKRLNRAVIARIRKELDKEGFIIRIVKYGYGHEVRRAIIIRKDTYLKIIRDKDRYAIAKLVIDYVFSNKHLFATNVKNNNKVLRIPTSIVKKLLRRIGIDIYHLGIHMGSVVLVIRALLESMGFKTELRRSKGIMGSVIYVYENGSDGGSRVTEAGERLLNPPGESQPGDGHVSNPTWASSNPNPVPGSGEVHTGEKEGAGHEEQQDINTRPNGVMGTAVRVHGGVSREGERNSGDKAQNHEGGRSRTTATQGGGRK